MATGVVDNTYYDLLEVPIDSTEPVIKKAYYKAAQRYHPDKPGGMFWHILRFSATLFATTV